MNNVSSQWHSIRPWRPTLSLSVREITSVSATFILSSPLSAHSLATLDPTISAVPDNNETERSEDIFANGPSVETHSQIISEALSKGLSVKVNGTPWQRVLMKIDDEADEAVIILFGLMPSRQYDIELGVVPGEAALRGQITTDSDPARVDSDIKPDASMVDVPSPEVVARSGSNSSLNSSHHAYASSTPPSTSSNSQTPALQSVTPTPSFSLEDRRVQLTHTLNLLNNEHATLTASLKTARREAQKADAALRSEIDTLKRASDKHSQQETRARQKVLALQEAVRRTVATTDEIRAMIKDVESMLPELDKRRMEVEKEWERVTQQARHVKAKRAEVEAQEKRRTEGLQAELAGLGNRMDRLTSRKEKLEGEGGVIQELEEKLRKLEEERRKVENDPFGYEDELGPDDPGEVIPSPSQRSRSQSRSRDSPSSDPQSSQHGSNQFHHHPHGHGHGGKNQSYSGNSNHGQHNHQPHHPRKRHSHPAHHGKQPPQPIQRPSHNPRLSLPAGPGVIHLNPSQSLHAASHKNQGVAGQGLSGRAQAFEPPTGAGVGRRSSQSSHGQTGSNTTKSELNPGSTPFSPRSAAATATATATASGGKRK